MSAASRSPATKAILSPLRSLDPDDANNETISSSADGVGATRSSRHVPLAEINSISPNATGTSDQRTCADPGRRSPTARARVRAVHT